MSSFQQVKKHGNSKFKDSLKIMVSHVLVCGMINSNLKSSYSFKKKYTINNLSLTSYSKRFLYGAVPAPGSTHDARMLKESSFFADVLNGSVLRDFEFSQSDYGDIPLVTIGDSAF